MKICRISISGDVRMAAVRPDGLVDITALIDNPRIDDMPLLLTHTDMGAISEHVRHAEDLIAFDSVNWLPPVGKPGKILGVGMNYHDFLTEARAFGLTPPPYRIWFYRPTSCLTGHNEEVWLAEDTTGLDYEAELAIVIGKRARNLSQKEAPSVIAGYTIANDITLREQALKTVVFAKSFDRQLPLGPWMVTADELGDPHNQGIRTWVNGVLRQNGNTKDMIAGCYELIAEVSSHLTLEPGDIILTGSPSGCGLFQSPPIELHPGDHVRTEIDAIGYVENRVSIEPRAA